MMERIHPVMRIMQFLVEAFLPAKLGRGSRILLFLFLAFPLSHPALSFRKGPNFPPTAGRR